MTYLEPMLQKIIHPFFKLLELLIVVSMVAMVFMVFGNVVLRYGFNSGIDVSDEMSRYCFVWLTYLGAMVAMREKGHLGVGTVLNVVCGVAKISMDDAFKGVLPFLLAQLGVLFLLVLFPQIVTVPLQWWMR